MPKNPIEGTYGPLKSYQEHRAESRANAWKYDADMERLSALQEQRPADFTPLMRMQLGLYLDQKAAAAEFGIDTGKDAA